MAAIYKSKLLLFIFLLIVYLEGLNLRLLAQSKEGSPRLMQGPMVGAVSKNEIRIWVRTSGAFPVAIEYGNDDQLETAQETEPVLTTKSNDYTAVIKLTNLLADTPYFYRVKVNGEYDRYLRDLPPFKTKTAPESGAKKNFRIAFGSCPRFQADRTQPIWTAVAAYQPDLFLWLGDNIYGDALDADILREEYRRQRDVAALQPVLHSVSNLAIWDDHDYGLNNHDRTHPAKMEALAVFRQYWANPSYGVPDVPGVFFHYTYGNVDFFFLDVRYYRDPNKAPDTPQKTMLGEKQLEWLKSELENSQAVFKILVSGSGWSLAKGPAGDSWSSFINERNALFNFIRDHKIAGVVLLSGDTHVGELNVIPWSEKGGYDFYDLVSSPLAQPPTDSWLERRPERRIRPVYFSGPNFGVIDVSFGDSADLIFRLLDSEGRSIWAPFELQAEELVNGVASWQTKVDSRENQRQKNDDQGKGYYQRRL